MKREQRPQIPIGFLVLFLGWLLAVPHPLLAQKLVPLIFEYGNIITLQEESTATKFGVPGPGVYVVNKQNQLVPVMSGGARMMWSGLVSTDWTEFSVGFRGFRTGMVENRTGQVTLGVMGVFVLILLTYIFYFRPRATRAEQGGEFRN